jgi:hypothetical protein
MFFIFRLNDKLIMALCIYLGGVGYNRRLYKKKIANANLLEVDSKLKFLKNKHFTSYNVSNVVMDPKISKEKQISLFFSMSFGIFVSFQKKLESLCFSNFIHMFTCNFMQM